MMKYLLVMFVLSLAACSDGTNPSEAEQNKATVFDGHLNALEKTREIENVLQRSADGRNEQLDRQ